MQKEELLKLRQKIVESAQQLALNGNGSTEDRLNILVDVISSGNVTTEVANKAFELAQMLDDDDQKLSAFMDIIYGVDQNIARSANRDAEAQQTSTPNQVEQVESPAQNDFNQ